MQHYSTSTPPKSSRARPRSRRPSRPFITPTLLDLPREVLRNIALHIYDPLELTQQDRLTWGIFSTVDMHEERQSALASLIAFGSTCRKVRREVKVLIFRCIRPHSVRDVEYVVDNEDGWTRFVRSIIIDLSILDNDADDNDNDTGNDERAVLNASADADAPRPVRRRPRRRTCWQESTLLTNLLRSLPNLEHISFFADASDDATLALLFSSLIPHPSPHSIPPPTIPLSPTHSPSSPSVSRTQQTPRPFAGRIRSFGWRQRAAPPLGFRPFAGSSTFVSTLHIIRHAHRLSFLVLDADLDEMDQEDLLIVCKELALREPPIGEEPEKVSLMVCGPIRGWGKSFLAEMTGMFKGVRELFFDRPLAKSMMPHETTFEDFTALLSPLSGMPHLRLLQIGSYVFPRATQTAIALHLCDIIPGLLVLGLLGEEGETNWWGIWRGVSRRNGNLGIPGVGVGDGDGDGIWEGGAGGVYDHVLDVGVLPLGEGHLRRLELEGGYAGVGADGVRLGRRTVNEGNEGIEVDM